jgi:membrane protease YdiL (CAAX protease family)
MSESETASSGPAALLLRRALFAWLLVALLHAAWRQFWTFVPTDERATLVIGAGLDVVALLLVVRVASFDRAAARWFASPTTRSVVSIVALAAATALLLRWWEHALPQEAEADPNVRQRAAGWPLWLSLVFGALVPALMEELLFRGLLQQRFVPLLGVPLAISVPAMLFALGHLNGLLVLPHFVFGVSLGAMRQIAGALWPCVVAHAAWNAHCVLASYGLP